MQMSDGDRCHAEEVERLLATRRQALGELWAMGVTGDVLRRLRGIGLERLRQMGEAGQSVELYRTVVPDARRTYAHASALAGVLTRIERIDAALARARADRSRAYRSRSRAGEPRRRGSRRVGPGLGSRGTPT